MSRLKLFLAMLSLSLVAATGVILGVILGLLLARRETREEILARVRDLEEKLRTQIEEAKPKISESVERGRKAAISGLQKAQEKVDEYADALQASLRTEESLQQTTGR
jgi:uncharacterized membrane-anchored protein YhcB (DUF1043 family)